MKDNKKSRQKYQDNEDEAEVIIKQQLFYGKNTFLSL